MVLKHGSLSRSPEGVRRGETTTVVQIPIMLGASHITLSLEGVIDIVVVIVFQSIIGIIFIELSTSHVVDVEVDAHVIIKDSNNCHPNESGRVIIVVSFVLGLIDGIRAKSCCHQLLERVLIGCHHIPYAIGKLARTSHDNLFGCTSDP